MTLRTFSALGAAFFLALASAPAQDRKLACDDKSRSDSKRSRVCEMRESTMAVTGNLAVDAAPNGGIRITGWDRNEILVRAKVEAWGGNDTEASGRIKEVIFSVELSRAIGKQIVETEHLREMARPAG